MICFHEKTQGDKAEIRKTSYTPSSQAQILALDALPVAAGGSTNAATHDILSTFDNGDVICLSADLETVRWVANLKSLAILGDASSALQHASTANAKAVSRGLLRGREDIVALLTPTSEEDSDIVDLTQVLSVISRNSNGRDTVSLLRIQPRASDLTTTPLSPLKLLVSWDLPKPAAVTISPASTPQYSLNVANGVLYISIDETILSYSFSGVAPALTSELSVTGLGVQTFLRLSQDALLTSSRQMLRVFDSKYNTLQAQRHLDSNPTGIDVNSPGKKRKLAQTEDGQEHASRIDLVAYFADASLVVALRENEIIGMQFDEPTNRKRIKVEGTRLIDALGKGLDSPAAAITVYDPQQLQKRKDKLDRYVSKGKVSKFERVFAADLGIELHRSSDVKKENELNGDLLTNGVGPEKEQEDNKQEETKQEQAAVIDKDDDAEEEMRKWRLPKTIPESQRHQYDSYAIYALSKIFSQVQGGSSTGQSRSSLKIDFFPPNVFQWLLHTGHLTKESIKRAMSEDAPQHILPSTAVTDKDVIRALVEFDPDLHILSAILIDEQNLSAEAVVQVVKLLLHSLDDQQKEDENAKLLTNGTADAEDAMDVDIDLELDAASHEIDRALSILNHGFSVRGNTLHSALTRLHKFPQPTVTTTLCSTLTRHDLESLLGILHSELKNGGWSTSYDFLDGEASAEAPNDDAVAIIATLLSCTLDAIGAGAWLTWVGTTASSESSEKTIESLHSDAHEALKGFWEMRFMRGLISEFLRFASNVPKSQKPSYKTLLRQGKPFAVTNDVDELPMLPLGAKPDMGIEKEKTSKGGKKENRSKREMGMLISKKVPKYSFERILI